MLGVSPVHVCMSGCVHVSVHAGMRACERASVRVRLHARARGPTMASSHPFLMRCARAHHPCTTAEPACYRCGRAERSRARTPVRDTAEASSNRGGARLASAEWLLTEHHDGTPLRDLQRQHRRRCSAGRTVRTLQRQRGHSSPSPAGRGAELPPAASGRHGCPGCAADIWAECPTASKLPHRKKHRPLWACHRCGYDVSFSGSCRCSLLPHPPTGQAVCAYACAARHAEARKGTHRAATAPGRVGCCPGRGRVGG